MKGAGAMLVACRLAGPALEAHYAGVHTPTQADPLMVVMRP
jgi:hypothetical protein